MPRLGTDGLALRRSLSAQRPDITPSLQAFVAVDDLSCRRNLADAVEQYYEQHKLDFSRQQWQDLINLLPKWIPRHHNSQLLVGNSALCPRVGGIPTLTAGLLLCFQYPVTQRRLHLWYKRWAGAIPAVPGVVKAFDQYRQAHNSRLSKMKKDNRGGGGGDEGEEGVPEIIASIEDSQEEEENSVEPRSGIDGTSEESQLGTTSIGTLVGEPIVIKDEIGEEEEQFQDCISTRNDNASEKQQRGGSFVPPSRSSATVLDDRQDDVLGDKGLESGSLIDLSTLWGQISQPTLLGHAYRELIRSTSSVQGEEAQRRHVELLEGFSRSMLARTD